MKAYACSHNGKIVMRTTSDSVRGARVNGLVVFFNIIPRETWADETIAEAWDQALARLAKEKPHEVVKVVEISVIEVAVA